MLLSRNKIVVSINTIKDLLESTTSAKKINENLRKNLRLRNTPQKFRFVRKTAK